METKSNNETKTTACWTWKILLHSYEFFRFKSFPKVREKSESFENFSNGKNIFFQNLCWGHPIGQFVIFLNFPAFFYWLNCSKNTRAKTGGWKFKSHPLNHKWSSQSWPSSQFKNCEMCTELVTPAWFWQFYVKNMTEIGFFTCLEISFWVKSYCE